MKTVLSTKLLSLPQKELLLNAGMGLVEYNALTIKFPKVEIPLAQGNYIFTSQNGVKAFLKAVTAHKTKINTKYLSCFCVGEKTKGFLEDVGLTVVETANNASQLGKVIVEKYQTNPFTYICGSFRRDELPHILSENKIEFKEITSYRTHLVKKQFKRPFDGILFFSPSGIKSYLQVNGLHEAVLFCIGKTTADEAKKHSDNIITANRPTVENVLVQAIKHLDKND